MRRIKVGDIFEIPLSNGKKAYGRYLLKSRMGPVIQVFNIITNENVSLDEIINSKELFPPVITGLFAAIKFDLWKVIGNIAPNGEYRPKFIDTNFSQDGYASTWYLWDGEKYILIGKSLSEELKKLEFLIVWNPTNVVKRIESGHIPFPYGELIRDNKFTPKK